MLYDHIEYNGNAYYIVEGQQKPPYIDGKNGEIRGPVFLLYNSSKINYEKCNSAFVYTGYDGEEDEVFLYFDSALYIRGDYL
jgi:hypothetical protein